MTTSVRGAQIQDCGTDELLDDGHPPVIEWHCGCAAAVTRTSPRVYLQSQWLAWLVANGWLCFRCLRHSEKSWCELIDLTINQSISQAVSQSINQSISQSVSQSINQSIKQSINQAINQSIKQSIKHAIKQASKQAIN